MRIISGEFKGRRLELPRNFTARPTTDFAREGLFNVLNNYLDYDDLDCLDLFSGTGAISFELVSRGCLSVLSIEKNEKHIAFIKHTIAQLAIKNIYTIKADVFKFLPSTSQSFDFIFADPPYELANIELIPDMIFKKEMLKPSGLFVFEHSKKIDFTKNPHFVELRSYGNVNFSFFR